MDAALSRLIGQHRPGRTLPQAFYTHAAVFEEDRRRIIKAQWHLVGHAAQVPEAGDYVLFRVCAEEVLVVRDGDGAVRAHYNVCRHRGSRLCTESGGRLRAFTCPYHGWTYRLDGTLAGARLMPDGFRPEDHGLQPCHVRECHGLIFVSLADQPAPFEEAMEPFGAYLTFHGIPTARVARSLALPTRANWKLVVENFIECYHCAPAHPEYSAVHSRLKLLAAGAGLESGPEEARRRYRPEFDAWKRRVGRLGHPCHEGSFGNGSGMARMPIKDGWLTESRDGRPVAPLMGSFREFDGGVTYLAFGYLGFLIASNDHAVLLRFTPRTERSTDVEATWLVDGGADAGTDYDPAEVSWLWAVTLAQDAKITENNQAGIASSRYRPGPYSEQERANRRFTQWYLERLTG